MIGYYNYTVILTYMSLVSSVIGIFLAAGLADGQPRPTLAIICLMVSGLCDMFDGKVARTKKDRTENEKKFGIQIDSLCDAICFGVLPAVIGYSVGMNCWADVPILVLFPLCAVIRLAYFNVAEEDRQKSVFRKMVRFTSFLSFPAMIGIALIAPEFVLLALKSQWTACVPYLRTLCVAGAFIPVSMLYSNLLVSRGRSGLFLAGTASMMAVQMLIIIFLWITGCSVQALLYFISALQVAWLPVWHTMAHREIGLRFSETLRDILPFALAAVIAALAGHFVAALSDGAVPRLAIKVVVTALVYAGIMYFSGARIFRESVDFFLSRFRRGGRN